MEENPVIEDVCARTKGAQTARAVLYEYVRERPHDPYWNVDTMDPAEAYLSNFIKLFGRHGFNRLIYRFFIRAPKPKELATIAAKLEIDYPTGQGIYRDLDDLVYALTETYKIDVTKLYEEADKAIGQYTRQDKKRQILSNVARTPHTLFEPIAESIIAHILGRRFPHV